MTRDQLLIAASTIWVVVTAILVMFMQAGFAFLEAGLTRMKNAGHIAGKNVLIFGLCSLVYWAVGFGLAFGDGGWLAGNAGFFPSVDELISVGQAPFDWFSQIPGAAGYLFEVVFAGVSLAIVWGAMAERAKLWVYFVFGICFTLIYSIVSHWIWSPHGWLFSLGMQDFAGSTVVHFQGALAGARRSADPRPAHRQVRQGRPREPDPGPQHPVRRARDAHPLVRLVRLQPGLDAVGQPRRRRLLRLRRADDEHRGRGGAVAGVLIAWWKLGKPDISMMLNGALGALVAITAASGFVAPWAAIVIGAGSGLIAVFGVIFVERIGIDDPIGAVAVHGMSGVWGTLACGLFAVPALASNLATGGGGLVYTGSLPPARRAGARPRRRRRLRLRHLVRLPLDAAPDLGASASSRSVESQGLDVHEHGMWGYPEFYIPVPGGYGTESHGHLARARAPAAPARGSVRGGCLTWVGRR